MNRIWLMALLFAVVALSEPIESYAADEKAGVRNSQPEHPLGLVAFASVDRLKERAESLAQALGNTGRGEKFLTSMVGGDAKVLTLLNSPGMDPTRPIGAMCFPRWFSGKGEDDDAEEPEFDLEDLYDNPLELLVGGSASMFVENSTLVICFPYKDRQQLLDDVCRVFHSKGENWVPAEVQPGWYQVDKQSDIRIGFANNYLLLVLEDGEEKLFDRNYPDFAKLARSSLGKNGFVYALYRKGLPFLVRDVMGPAFKLAFAARFQKQDGESDIQFRLRTMSSALQMQLLDLAISHVEEIRITGHVDSTTKTVFIEPEIVGPQGGKLAKYFNEGKATSSVFAGQPTDDAMFAASMTLRLPAKDWKPTVDTLYAFAQSLGKSSGADIVRVFAKTIESGQFELYSYNLNWQEGLIALRHEGGAPFSDQLQEMLTKLLDPPSFEIGVDAVEGIPIHRTLATLDHFPAPAILAIPLQVFFGQEPELPQLEQLSNEVEVGGSRKVEVLEPDGTQKVIVEEFKEKRMQGADCLWLAATPRVIFLGFGSAKSGECPDWFKTQVAASLQAPASGRSKSPFQITLRDPFSMSTPGTLHKSSRALEGGELLADGTTYVKPAAAARDEAKEEFNRKIREDNQNRENARLALLRDLPNAIRCEFRSTETGAKLSITLEEAYFQWFATMIRDSQEMDEAIKERPPERIDGAPERPGAARPAK